MFINSLYNSIQHLKKSSKIKLPKGIKIIHLEQKSSGTNYFLFDIPITESLIIDNKYTLSSHHISIYNTQKLNDQYHYTAYFTDKLSQRYRLHVYFNYKEEIVGKPTFELCLNENQFKSINVPQLTNSFNSLASLSSAPIILKLRNAQETLISKLQDDLNVLEEESDELSKELIKNKKKYLENIVEQISILELLKKCSNENQKFFSQIKCLNKLMQSVENMEEEKEENSQLLLDNELIDSDVQETKQVFTKENGNSHFKVSKKTQKKEHKNEKNASKELIKQIEYCTTSFKLLETYNTARQVNELLHLYNKIHSFQDLINLGYETVRQKEKGDITKLKNNIDKYGNSLLQKLLIKGDYILATKLNPFFHTLQKPVLLTAIGQNNIELLDFLFKNKIFSANFYKFKLNKIKYASLIDYCFKNSTIEHPLSDLLSLIIQHGASLLEQDFETGLPFAATLLLNDTHSLRPALDNNADAISNNLEFYKAFNEKLQKIPSNSTTYKKYQSEINELIGLCNLAIEGLKLKHCASKLKQSSYEKHSKIDNNLLKLSDNLTEMLSSMSKLSEQIDKITSDKFIPELPKEQSKYKNDKNFELGYKFGQELIKNSMFKTNRSDKKIKKESNRDLNTDMPPNCTTQ